MFWANSDSFGKGESARDEFTARFSHGGQLLHTDLGSVDVDRTNPTITAEVQAEPSD